MEATRLTHEMILKDMVDNAALAGRTCHRVSGTSVDNVDFLKKLISYGHESVLEHINLTFICADFSRALLQEVARHRHISLSVESTRHAMHKRLENKNHDLADKISDILTMADIPLIDELVEKNEEQVDNDDDKLAEAIAGPLSYCVSMLNKLRCFISEMQSKGVATHVVNDFCKYLLPECFPTTFVMTLNLRELRHIFKLRTSPAALLEFRTLCIFLYDKLPEWFRPLVDDCMDKDQLEVYHEAKKRA